MTNRVTHKCDRCQHEIGLFITHVLLSIQMMNGKGRAQRYCADCCADPSMAVLFADMLDQPVQRMQITKVWG